VWCVLPHHRPFSRLPFSSQGRADLPTPLVVDSVRAPPAASHRASSDWAKDDSV